MIRAPVKVLVILATANAVSGVMGTSFSRSAAPPVPTHTVSSGKIIATEMPGIAYFLTIPASRASRASMRSWVKVGRGTVTGSPAARVGAAAIHAVAIRTTTTRRRGIVRRTRRRGTCWSAMMAARYRLRHRGYHPRMPDTPTAAALFRSVGLLADGPAVWGRPVPAPGPGVFVLELPAPLATAPIELTRVGKWIERVETLQLDGARPSSRALAARLAAFWLPSQTVVYIGATDVSVGRRVASIGATGLGDRRPSSSGHWLKTLRSLDGIRVWWSLTAATEEYEDALLTAFAEGVSAAERAALPDPDVVLPFGNLRRPTGERRASGITGSLLPEPTPAAPDPAVTRIVDLPDGEADGARDEAKRARRPAPGRGDRTRGVRCGICRPGLTPPGRRGTDPALSGGPPAPAG